MRVNRFIVTGALLLISGAAMAQVTTDGVVDVVKQGLSASATNLIAPKVMGWLGAFLTLQFCLTNYRKLLQGADLQEIMAKLVGALFSAGLCITAVTYGPEFIDSVGNDLLSHFLSSVPGTGSVLAVTLSLATAILTAAGVVSAVNNALASVLTMVFWIVLGGGVYLACKVFMFYLELGMVVVLSPISFALLGLDNFRDQGLAPIKSLVSLVYRAVLFGVVFGIFKYVSDSMVDTINGINWFDVTGVATNISKLVSALIAFPILLFLTFKSDSIAATLAGGSTSLGNAAAGQAVAAGAAAGAAAAAAGSATTGAAGKVPQSMAAFIDNLSKMAGGGSISNASPMGVGCGDAPVFTRPASTPSLSVGAPAADGASAASPPQRPQASDAGTQSVGSGRYGAEPQETSPESARQAQAPGNASGVAIGGPPGSGASKMEETLEKLTNHLTQPKKPTLGERLGEANRHLSQEQAETRISMSGHGHD
ncbi:hypothetical protein [Cupriavidus pinatubonensis]|uniref:TrbL/VirB6 plasmid conjugal transfer protein n=1 Tax=Cupriavidus pinatubonensis TaxID=248026 RepID=A0ABM8WSG6_9BURK|nr:hypothetical protein [Cupriavidus pinatubonensis]CAG9170404.1 hypothetical protein LMG23994_01882 [Cupriavidus pinatubonensis]